MDRQAFYDAIDFGNDVLRLVQTLPPSCPFVRLLMTYAVKAGSEASVKQILNSGAYILGADRYQVKNYKDVIKMSIVDRHESMVKTLMNEQSMTCTKEVAGEIWEEMNEPDCEYFLSIINSMAGYRGFSHI